METKQYASWKDIETIFEIDTNSTLKQRQVPKLTQKHIDPKLIPKMRVKYASQVFSKSVANFIDIILNLSNGKSIKALKLRLHYPAVYYLQDWVVYT